MRLLSSLSSALLLAAAATVSPVSAKAAAAAVSAASVSVSVTFQLGLPRKANAGQQDPSVDHQQLQALLAQLPSWTHATLDAGNGKHYVSAPLTAGGALVFGNVTAGSYLGEVHSSVLPFGPVRLDVDVDEGAVVAVSAFESYRGNSWENLGEALPRTAPASFIVRPLAAVRKQYYTERSTFSALSVLKNPMILVGLVTMGIVVGMPYLVDNMDPEMRAEWEERQKSGSMNSLLGAGGGGGSGGRAAPGAGFDMAAFLAGSSQPASSSGSRSGSPGPKSQGGGGVRR